MTEIPEALAGRADENSALVDHALDLMAVLDRDGRYLRINAAAHDILGYHPDELVGRHFLDLMHPDERAAVRVIEAELLAGTRSASRDLENRWIRKDGQVVSISISARWSAERQRMYVSARDVTRHREARDELNKSEARLHDMLETIGEAFFAIDRDWRITYANRKAGAFIGVAVETGLGKALLDIAPELRDTPLLDFYRNALERRESGTLEVFWPPTATWLEVRAFPTGEGLAVYFHVITARRLAEEALRKSEERFRNLFQQAGDSILIITPELRIVAANGRACAKFGFSPDEFRGLSVRSIDSGFEYSPEMVASLRAGQTQLLRMAKIRKDGSVFPAEVHVSRFEEGGQEFFQAIIRDTSTRDEAERQLRESEQRFREIIEMTPAGYLLASRNGVLLDVNPALCALSGYSREELTGSALPQLLPGFSWDHLAGASAARMRGLEATVRHRDGYDIHVLLNGSIKRDTAGQDESMTVLMTDITERKLAESRLHELATHDTLTGLPNRALLNERVQLMLDQCPRNGSIAVMFLDLDRFKEVNDSFGHELGDILLCEVATRLKQVLRPGDAIARLGGDEFVVAAQCSTGNAAAARIAEKLLEVLTRPVNVGGQDVIIGASIGISMFPTDAQTKEVLFQAADTAMYRAKESGRNRYRFFEAEMSVATRARMELEVALRPALARREFELHYQPRLDLRTMSIIGMEALIRWNHPERGRIAPQQFIPIAEETGMIVAIGRWVLHQACAQSRRVIDEFGTPLRVSVNVSARQLAQHGFVDEVRTALYDTGLPPDCLELELTESALIEDIERTADMLRELHGLGVKLAVDDFGTGYSGLAYLRRFPIDVLKLDRSFVLQDDDQISTFDFVKAFVDMAHALKLSVVAEGVETADVLDFLQATACDQGQGYYLARPMPLDALRALLREPAALAARARPGSATA
jgi:diguanylate cyclase (GGDEF)-like protein/PAS domain S-box-containing protein